MIEYGWKKFNNYTFTLGYRSGWLGLWDHFKNLTWRRHAPHFVSQTVTVSFWYKEAGDKALMIAGPQAEINDPQADAFDRLTYNRAGINLLKDICVAIGHVPKEYEPLPEDFYVELLQKVRALVVDKNSVYKT